MKCKFCGAEVKAGERCEYCGSFAEPLYYGLEMRTETIPRTTKDAKKKRWKAPVLDNRSSSDKTSYTIKPGDSLWKITKRFYGTTSLELCKKIADHNGIEDMNKIFPGEIIVMI